MFVHYFREVKIFKNLAQLILYELLDKFKYVIQLQKY